MYSKVELCTLKVEAIHTVLISLPRTFVISKTPWDPRRSRAVKAEDKRFRANFWLGRLLLDSDL